MNEDAGTRLRACRIEDGGSVQGFGDRVDQRHTCEGNRPSRAEPRDVTEDVGGTEVVLEADVPGQNVSVQDDEHPERGEKAGAEAFHRSLLSLSELGHHGLLSSAQDGTARVTILYVRSGSSVHSCRT